MKDHKVKEFYEDQSNAGEYDNIRFTSKGGLLINEKDEERIKKVVSRLPKDAKILDVAAGTGRVSLPIARMGYTNVTAFDNSEAMLSHLKTKAEAENLNINTVVGDASALPFDPDEFDMVISLRFLWHFKDYDPFMKEMLRVSKDDGFVYVDFLNAKSLRSVVELGASFIVYSALSSPRKVNANLAKYNAEIIDLEWDFFFPYFFYRKAPSFLVNGLHSIDQKVTKGGMKNLGSVFYTKIQKNRDHSIEEL